MNDSYFRNVELARRPIGLSRFDRWPRLTPIVMAAAGYLMVSAAAAQHPVGVDGVDSQLKTYPLTATTMQVVSNVPYGIAGANEKLIYDNPLGDLVAELPPGLLVADDLKLAVRSDCPLRRYRFQVVGKAYEQACGPVGTPCPPLTVNFALYDECPGAGGVSIPGTEGCASSDPARTDCIPIDSEALTEINFVVPPETPVLLPSSVWLGLMLSRSGAGFVLGAPAIHGFSGDAVDLPNFPCNANLGGFPRYAHASYNASVFGDPACVDAFPTYQNVQASGAGLNMGADVCLADDLTLNRPCNMVELEIGVRNRGRYDVELRTSTDGLPTGPCAGRDDFGLTGIPGTYKIFLVTQDGLAVKRFTFDPPIPLTDKNIFAVMTQNTVNGQWILTRRQATIGSSENPFFAWGNGGWESRIPNDNSRGNMYFTITCDGTPPSGACCDMYITDENGDSVCRELPDFNCSSYAVRDSDFQPKWVEAATCADEPFPLPCGQAACCKPDDTCENLTEAECNAVPPVERPRIWDRGLYCGDWECSFNACLNSPGDCLIAHDSPGCTDPFCCDNVCQVDYWCCSVQWDDLCERHANELCDLPPPNDTCAPTSWRPGARRLIVGAPPIQSYTIGASSDSGDSFCCHGGFRHCEGGELDGIVCETGLDCGVSPGVYCGQPVPEPGNPGFASVWYYFTVPDDGDAGGTTNIELSTCGSRAPATDSLLQAFAIREQDRGVCDDLGLCDDGSLCTRSARDCVDGHTCRSIHEACSMAAQDCPLGKTCVLDAEAACDSRSPIGCNDDAADGCGAFNQPGNSKLCLPNLIRGDTYLATVAVKSQDAHGYYQISAHEVPSCPGTEPGVCAGDTCTGGGRDGEACTDNPDCAVPLLPPNDFCTDAIDLTDLDQDLTMTEPFDLTHATFDCQSAPCSATLQNDLWYRVVAPVRGEMTVSTCGDTPETSPDTEFMVYTGCVCPVEPVPTPWCANAGNSETCPLSAEETGPVEEGECYTIRLGDDAGHGGQGVLTVSFEFIPNCPAQTIAWVEPDDGAVDARAPTGMPPGDTLTGTSEVTVYARLNADPECFSLCETNEHPDLHPHYPPELVTNGVVDAVAHDDGTLTLKLKRPVTPAEMTAITYTDETGAESTWRMSALPADVSGDKAANAADVLTLIDILNATATPVWGTLSADCDHSGVIGAADVLCVIDLLNAGFNDITIGGTIDVCP